MTANAGEGWGVTLVRANGMTLRAKIACLAGAVAVLVGGAFPAVRAAESGVDDGRSPARCAEFDSPETDVQGDVPRADQESGRAEQGYNCGLALVGYNDLGGQGNGSLARSGNCAY